MNEEQNEDINVGDLVIYTPEAANWAITGVVIGRSHSETIYPHVIIMVKWQIPNEFRGIVDGWYPYGVGFSEIRKI